MITLRDLLDATWDVTLLRVDLRKPDGELIQRYILGEGQCEDIATAEQKSDMNAGKLEMIDAKINHRGDIKSNGMSEIAYSPNLDGIPADLLETQVTSFYQRDRTFGGEKGSMIHAHVCRVQQTLGDLLEGGTP